MAGQGTDKTEAVAALIGRGAHRDALTMCSERLGPDLGRFCLAVLSIQEDAEDAVQETLVRFHDAMPTLGDTPVQVWLYETALEMCDRRLSARTPEQTARALSIHPEDPNPSDDARARRKAREMRIMLSKLEREHSDLLALRYVAGLSYGIIGAIKGISAERVATDVGKALLNLRQVRVAEGAA